MAVGLLKLTTSLLLIAVAVAEDELTTTSVTSSTIALGPITATEASQSDKLARRIIDDRLSPPRATDFATPWNSGPRLPIGEVHRVNLQQAPRVTEDIDDGEATAQPKKTRTEAGAGCCGSNGKSSPANGLTAADDRKEKSPGDGTALEVVDLERAKAGGNNAAAAAAAAGNSVGPVARFHGNRPSDDRYGWRSSSYLGYGKDKGYYDQRNHYPYDRYSSSNRPTSNYGGDSDRYSGGSQRPSSSSSSAYGSDSSDRFSSSSGNLRPSNNYPSANYGYGYGGDKNSRPPLMRPGSGNYETDSDYPFAEGGPPPNAAHLQTQKAVALKALAGVALIGAAAALASNPVLLPLGVISGRRRRRKRSAVQIQSDNYALTALLQGYIQPNEVAHGEELTGREGRESNSSGDGEETTGRQELVISPECVARLACHVHRDYLDELEKSRQAADSDKDDDTAFHGLEHWFDSLIHSNILAADYLSNELKSLIQSAVAVGSDRNATCDKFSCLNVYNSTDKKTA